MKKNLMLGIALLVVAAGLIGHAQLLITLGLVVWALGVLKEQYGDSMKKNIEFLAAVVVWIGLRTFYGMIFSGADVATTASWVWFWDEGPKVFVVGAHAFTVVQLLDYLLIIVVLASIADIMHQDWRKLAAKFVVFGFVSLAFYALLTGPFAPVLKALKKAFQVAPAVMASDIESGVMTHQGVYILLGVGAVIVALVLLYFFPLKIKLGKAGGGSHGGHDDHGDAHGGGHGGGGGKTKWVIGFAIIGVALWFFWPTTPEAQYTELVTGGAGFAPNAILKINQIMVDGLVQSDCNKPVVFLANYGNTMLPGRPICPGRTIQLDQGRREGIGLIAVVPKAMEGRVLIKYSVL